MSQCPKFRERTLYKSVEGFCFSSGCLQCNVLHKGTAWKERRPSSLSTDGRVLTSGLVCSAEHPGSWSPPPPACHIHTGKAKTTGTNAQETQKEEGGGQKEREEGRERRSIRTRDRERKREKERKRDREKE